MADNRPVFDVLLGQPSIDINLRTTEDHPPLYYALLKYESGDDTEDSYACRLLARGAHPNPLYPRDGSDSLLHLLVAAGAEKAAVHLLDHVQNIDHANAEGETALHVACLRGRAAVVAKLLRLGANPNPVSNELRRSPLHCAVLGGSAGCVEEFIRLGGADFNARDANGDTPVGLALNDGHRDLVPVLIRGKADVNVRNGKDFTLLHQAILKEDGKTAIFLLDNGADINAQ